MPLTARQLNRATLARQGLLARERVGVVAAVARAVAIQSQEPASPYLALWNRVAALDAAAVDDAFATHAIVRATLVRITLHTVTAEDYPAFQHAMVGPRRASRLNDRRYLDTGATAADADALAPKLLRYLRTPRTNAEVDAWVTAQLGHESPRMWWALRTFAPVLREPGGGRPTYRASPFKELNGDATASERYLVRRYLEGFGPATAQDIGLFTILRMPAVKPALERLAADGVVVRHEGPDGMVLHDVADGRLPPDDVDAPPRLLGMWENSLLAYAERERIIPAAYRPLVIRRNGDTLASVLVNGRVVGVWRPAAGASGIEVATFEKLSAATWRAVGEEAGALTAFLADVDPDVHRRYRHWWEKLDAAETKVVG